MKRIIVVGLTLFLLFAAVTAFADAVNPLSMIITSDTWQTTEGTIFSFHNGGTGESVDSEGNVGATFNWAVDGGKVVYSFTEYPAYKFELVMMPTEDNHYYLCNLSSGICFYSSSYVEEMKSNTEDSVSTNMSQLTFGDKINFDFVKIGFSHASIQKMISTQEKTISIEAPSGSSFLTLVGTIENTGRIGYPISLTGKFIVNDYYEYSMHIEAMTSDRSLNQLEPLSEATLYLYAIIPKSLKNEIHTVKVQFSFNDNFATPPILFNAGKYCYELTFDDSAFADPKNGSILELKYYDECPALPIPSSYMDIHESGSGSSSVNGKTKSIYYTYDDSMCEENILAMAETYLKALDAAGLDVTEDGEGKYIVKQGGVLLANITVSSVNFKVEIKPGNENISPNSEAAEVSIPRMEIGQVIRTDNFTMSIEENGTAGAIYSSIKKDVDHYYLYQEALDGFKLFYLFGTFENTSGEPMHIPNIYVEFNFDGKYRYDGKVVGVGEEYRSFVSDVPPLTSVNYYVYASIPETLLDTYTTCTIKLGFTDNFGIKFCTDGGLDDFDFCDQVFEINADKASVESGKALSPENAKKEYHDKNIITSVQGALNNLGYNCGKPDGKAGKKTTTALKDFQRDYGLSVTGTVTGETLEALGISIGETVG